MNERSRRAAAPSHRTRHDSARRGGRIPAKRWWDDPGSLSDDELLRVVRGMVAVDRSVDRFRGRGWPR